MAYGSPVDDGDLERYYTDIRRGRPPSAEELQDLADRYAAIGGLETLRRWTEAQRQRIAAELAAISPNGFTVRTGFKHTPPFIEDVVAEFVHAGSTELVGVVMAPHASNFSIGEYVGRAQARAAELGATFRAVPRWSDLAEFRTHQSKALRTKLAESPEAFVLFTAHSLPERVLVGDPYPDDLYDSAAAIAAEAGLARWGRWALGWQSAGRSPEPWRGPDVLTVIDQLADSGRATSLVVVPQGFVSEHLEVRYDLDIQAAQHAAQRGLEFARTAVVNDDPVVLGALARRIATVAG
jgi:ferrochelatase